MNKKKFDLKKYNEVKNELKTMVCDKCGNETNMHSLGIRVETILDENKSPMEVTFFVCKKCDKIYIISIINQRAKNLQRQHKMLDKKFSNLKKLNQQPTEEDINNFLSVKEKFIKYQEYLKNRYEPYFTLKKKDS